MKYMRITADLPLVGQKVVYTGRVVEENEHAVIIAGGQHDVHQTFPKSVPYLTFEEIGAPDDESVHAKAAPLEDELLALLETLRVRYLAAKARAKRINSIYSDGKADAFAEAYFALENVLLRSGVLDTETELSPGG